MSCGKPCGCESYRTHLLSVGFSAAAMPSRRPVVADTIAKETVLSRDMDAYKRLRRDGTQPVRIDGCAAVEKIATTAAQVEGRPWN